MVARRHFEIAATVLWEGSSSANSGSWSRISTAMHGIRLVASGRVKEDAEFLYDIAGLRCDIEWADECDRRKAA